MNTPPPTHASLPAAEVPGLPSWRSYLSVVVTLPLAAALTLLPHQFLWGAGFKHGWFQSELFSAPFPMPRAGRLLVMLLSLGLHEVLHGVGYAVFGRVPWSKIDFRVRWKHLIVYAWCGAALSRSAIQKALLLPAMVLGVLPAAIGLVFGQGWLTFYGFILLLMATGDFTTLWRMWRAPRGAIPQRSRG